MKRDVWWDKPRFDLLYPLCVPYEEQMMTRFANLLARWAKKYSERNREVAETIEELNRFKESAMRHMIQRLCWEEDEDHSCWVRFNLMGAEMVKYKLKKKDMQEHKSTLLPVKL